jgi:hypothetical protein
MTLLLAAAVGLLLGTALGVFGGGGGILAVPLLVGLLGMDIDQAATASLVIVLFGALGGLVSHHRAGRVRWRAGLAFGAASVVGSLAGATLATRVADWIKLGSFAVLMVVAGIAMLRNARSQPRTRGAGSPGLVAVGGPRRARTVQQDPAFPDPGTAGPDQRAPLEAADQGAALVDMPAADLPRSRRGPRGGEGYSVALILLLATGTGLVTGFLGVGGGFLVVPALVLAMRMPVVNATATGLVVIAIASTSALLVRLSHHEAAGDAAITAVAVVATVAASLASARFSGRLSPRTIGTGFALLVLAMSAMVAAQAWQAAGA